MEHMRMGPARRAGPLLKLSAAVALGLMLALAVALGLSFAAGLAGRWKVSGMSTTAPAQVAAAGTQQCYAWDVFNATGADADGLRVRLTGVQSVATVYAGDANPLGGPRAGSGYDAASDSYVLEFGQNAATVAAGETVKVGVCTPDVAAGAGMQWLAGAAALGDAVSPPAVAWQRSGPEGADVQVKNTGGVPITVVGVRLLATDDAPALDDLDEAAAGNLAAGGDGLETPAMLGPSAAITLPLALGSASSEPVVVAVEWADGDDLAATSTAYLAAEVTAGSQLFLPAISR